MLKTKNILILLLLVSFFAFDCRIIIAEEERGNQSGPVSQKEAKAYANYCTGLYLMTDQRWEEAIESFKKALQLSLDTERVHNLLATCYFQLDQKDEAIFHIEKVAELKPDDFGIHYTLGSIYENEGLEKKAISEYERANGCAKEDIDKVFISDTLFRLSNLYAKHQEMEKAINVYTTIIDAGLTNEPEKIHYRLGQINFELKKFEEAIVEFKKTREFDPSLETLSFNLALCYEELEDYESAITELNRFVKDHSDAWLIRISLSNMYDITEQYEKADLEREKAFLTLKKNTEGGSADIREYIVLCQLFQRKGENSQAIETLKAAVSNALIDKEDIEARKEVHLLTANVYYDMNDHEGVVKELREVLQIAPDCHQASNFLGYFYVERGEKFDEAINLIEEALKSEPQNGAYLDSLGWAYYKLATDNNDDKKLALALQTLIEASKYAEDPEITEHIGDVNYSLGFWEEAQKQWETALSLWEKTTEGPSSYPRNRTARELKAIKAVKRKLEKLQNLKIEDNLPEDLTIKKEVVSNHI